MKKTRAVVLGGLMCVLLAACQAVTPLPEVPATSVPNATVAATAAPAAPAVILELQGFVQRVHDPVIAHAGDTYYVFSTGSRIPITCSKDMLNWEFCGRVFEQTPAWTREVNRDLVDLWAPDISFFNDQWHLYYAASNYGSQESAIALATNVTLDPQNPNYKWVDQGVVLRSKTGDEWNAIDPNLVLDQAGEPWLAWGSFWHGIWMRKIDKASGQLSASDTQFHQLADRSSGPDNTTAIEAPFIVQRQGLWYLFTSFDQCCEGVTSTYNVHVGRSDALTGPYLDREGLPMTKGGGSLLLAAYDRWKGPGHNAVLIEDGVYWMVYHAYDAKQIGIPKLRIESIAWDADGWPSLPSQSAP